MTAARSPKDMSRLVQLAMIGAVAGAIGQDLLRDLPTSWLVGTALVILAAVLAWVR